MVVTVLYEVNPAVKTFTATVYYQVDGELAPRHTNSEVKGYIGQDAPIPEHLIAGYVVKAGQPSTVKISENNDSEVTVLYVVDKTSNAFSGTIEYLVDGEEEPRVTRTVNGYIGQQVTIPSVSIKGYIPAPTQPTHITINADNDAVATVVYIVDTDSEEFSAIVNYQVENEAEPRGSETLYGHINEKMTIPSYAINGYKVKANQQKTVTILEKSIVKVTVFYEVDQTVTTFSGAVKYQVENETTPRYTKTVKGYIGQDVPIPEQPITGYQVKVTDPAQPTTIKILENGTAEITILYEVNELVTTFSGTVHYQVENETTPRFTKTVKGYIGEDAPIPEQLINGYQVKVTDPAQPTTIKILEDGSAVKTIIYEVNQEVKTFKGTVKYQVDGEDAPRYTKTIQSYIGHNAPIPEQPILGYKVKTHQPTTVLIKEDNSVVVTVLYEVNPAVKTFTATVYYQVDGELTPRHTNSEVKGYIGQDAPIPEHLIAGYVVKAGQPSTVKISENNDSEVTVLYVVDKTSVAFSGTVKYQIQGETTPKHTTTVNGYIGQTKGLPVYPILGYKVVGDSPSELVIKEDNTATATVWYMVDVDQQFGYKIHYLLKDNTVLRDPLIAHSYIRKLTGLAHPNIPGYKLDGIQPTQINIVAKTGGEYNELTIYYVKDDNQWTTITFDHGVNASTTDQKVFNVIKNHPFNGANQPPITLPTITPNSGYQIDAVNPWLPAYDPSHQVSNAKTYEANVVVKEDTKFAYKVNYLLQGGSTSLHKALEGTHHIGKLNLTHPTIPGYLIVSGQSESINIVAVEAPTVNQLDIFYVKDNTQWTTIKFIPSINGNGEEVTYDVIKNHPLDGDNQLDIVAPTTFTAKNGYILNDENPWLPSFALTNKVLGPTTYTANMIVDETVEFAYKVNYLIQGGSTSLHKALEGMHHIGKLDLTHPTIPGYSIVSGQVESINIVAVTGTDVNELTIRYVKDNSQWTTIKFIPGTNGNGEEVTYNVIKNHPLNGDNQLDIVAPTTFTAKNGYKVDEAQAWAPSFALTNSVSGPTTYTANIIVDKTVKYGYKVTYILAGTSIELKDALEGMHYIDNLPLTHPETIPGYRIIPYQPTSINIVAKEAPDVNKLTIFYAKDNDQWATLKFLPGDHATLSGQTEYEVIINHPLKGRNQPSIIIPTIVPEDGYMIDPTGDWDPDNESFNQIAADTTLTAQVIINPAADTFIGTIFYQVNGEPTHRKQVQVNGPIGDYVITPHPAIPGYKVMPDQPESIHITNDNKAQVTVLYEIDITANTFKGTVYYRVQGELTPRHTNSEVKGYIGENVPIPEQAITGYKVADNQPTTIKIKEDGSAVATINYVPDETYNTVVGTVKYQVEGEPETDPRDTKTVQGYIGEDVLVPEKTIKGYKVKDGQTSYITIEEGGTAVKILLYVVDQNVKTFEATVHYHVEGEPLGEPRHTKILKGYIGESVGLPAYQIAGYRIKEGHPTHVIIKEDDSASVTLLFEVNPAIKMFTGKVYHKIDGAESAFATDNLTGYIGEVKTITHQPPTGYKVKVTDPAQPTTIQILENNSATETVLYEVDQTVDTYAGTIYYQVDGEPTHRYSKVVYGYIGEDAPIPEQLITGYKVKETIPAQPTIIKIKEDGSATATVLYEVNQAINTFEGTVHYQIDGETNPKFTKTVKGYIGEDAPIPEQLITGYKVKETDPAQPTTIKIKEDGSAVATVLYEVNQAVTFDGKVHHKIDGADSPFTTENLTGYIGEVKTITYQPPTGYKAKDGAPTQIQFTGDDLASETVLYVIDTTSTDFSAKVHHKIEGAELPFATDELTGYIGEVKTIIYQPPTGYKVKETVPAQPTQVILDKDSVVEVTITYVVNQAINTFTGKVYHQVEGEENARFTDNFTGYINEVKDITHRNINGYKVKETDPAQPTTITILEDNSAVETILYVVDQDVKTFKGTVYYKIETEETARITMPVTGYIGEDVLITPQTITGYKVKETVPAQPTTIQILENNKAEATVVYVIDTLSTDFSAVVYHKIEGAESEFTTENFTGYIGEEKLITHQPPTGYKVKANQATKVVLVESASALEVTVLYEVNQAINTFEGIVKYQVENEVEPRIETTVEGYINEVKGIPVEAIAGYKVKTDPVQPTTITILADGSAVATVLYEVDTNQRIFKGTVKYQVAGEENARITKEVTGCYIGEKAPIPAELINGYKVKTDPVQPTTITILENNSATATVLYEVNQNVKTFIGKVHHQIEGAELPFATDELTGYIGEVKTIVYQQRTGYKVKETVPAQPTTIKITEDGKAEVTIIYVIDTLSTAFSAKVHHKVEGEETARFIDTHNGHINEVKDITHRNINGYKVKETDPAQPTTITILEDNSAVETILYVVDQDVKTFKGTVYYKIETEETARITMPVTGYIGEDVLITPQTITGYKVKETVPAQPTTIQILENNKAEATVVYVIDTLSTDFSAVVYHKIEGAESEFTTENFTGYIGEEKLITHQPPTGYKVKANQATKVVLVESASALEVTVLYEVNQAINTFEGIVKYQVENEVEPRIETTVEGYINEVKGIPVEAIAGYKVKTDPVQPTTITILADGSAVATVLYEVDTNQRIFKGTVKYQVAGEENARITKEVTGCYIGEKAPIPAELINGYKVKTDPVQPTTITILENNSATATVLYEVNQNVKTFIGKVHHQIEGAELPFATDELTGYIGEVKTIVYQQRTGYKVKETVPAQPTTIKITEDGKAEVTIIYVIDTLSTAFSAKVHHKVEGEETARFIDTHNGHINEVKDITHRNINGYKVKVTDPAQPTTIKILEDNSAVETILYVVDQDIKTFKGMVYYRVGNEPTPRHSEEVKGYIGQVVPIPEHDINGYKVKETVPAQPTTITIKEDNTAIVYVLYEVNQTVKTFSGIIEYRVLGEETARKETTVTGYIGEVIGITPHGIAGYKVVEGAPTTITIKESNNAKAIVYYEIDHEYKFFTGQVFHKINGVTKDTDDFTGYIKQEHSITNKTYPGYRVDTNQPTSIIITEDNKATRTVNYVKESSQWTTITFAPGSNATLTGATTYYEVIKNHPLNGDNQPPITKPTINPNLGYKVNDTQDWLPAFATTNMVSEPTTYTANVIVDTEQLFVYKVNYLEQGTNDVLRTALEDTHYIGNLPLIHPEIPGYLIVGEQLASIDIVAVEGTDINELTIYYVKDNTQWTTIKFVSGINGTGATTMFTVIKDHPLNGDNQPTITPPTFTAKNGYKLVVEDPWVPTFALTNEVADVTIYEANMVVDTNQLFPYQVKYLLQGTETSLHDPLTGDLCIGNHKLDHPTIPGYQVVLGEPDSIDIVAVTHPHINAINVYYEENSSQWTTITFAPGPNATLTGTFEYDVIKDHPLNGAHQPDIVVPNIIPDHEYMLVEATPWLPAFDLANQVAEATTYTANVVARTKVNIHRNIGIIKIISSQQSSSRAILTQDKELYYVGQAAFYAYPSVPAITEFTMFDRSLINNEVIKDFVMGEYHYMILTELGNVYVWGQNNEGQLGLGHRNDVAQPTLLTTDGLYNNETIIRLFAGPDHSAFLTRNNDTGVISLYTFGYNASGQLGLRDRTRRITPTLVNPDDYGNKAIKDIVLSIHNLAILTEDGILYMSGSNYSGQMTDVVSLVPQAKLVEITTVGKVKQVTMGHDHTVIINEHDEAYAFGHNRFGQLGIPINPNNPNQSNKTPTPQLLLNGQKVQFVNAGKEWTFVYTMDNKLYATGENTDQQLGLNSSVANVTPLQLVPAAHYGNQRLIAVSAGDDNTSFVTVNNDIYACGGNENGELGLGHQNSPVAIPQLSVGAEPVVTYYAKPADTLDSGAVHTLTKMLTEYLSKAGYTFEVYSDSSYSTPINLTDLVGSVERNIYIRYIQDETEWTTITFDVGSNAITDDETVFNVIKNVPLNDPSQPEIVLPTVIAKSGYVVDPNNPWLPAFDQTATLSGPMTYVVNLIKLEQRTIEYYIEGQTELYSTAIVEGVVGQSVSIPTPEIPGYVLRGGQTLTVEILAPSSPPHPSVPIYYDKDTTQWVELTFNGGDKTSVVDGGVNNTVALEVIKDHPLNGVNQPAIPTYTITNTDYYNESPTELWTLNSVIISQDIVITDAMIASGTTLVPYITKRTKVNVYMPIYVYDFNVSSDYTELLSSYGNIYKFGNNDVGQLGFDDVTASNYPTQLHPNTYNFEKVKQIVSSQTHSAIVTDSNKLYVYGNNEFGQLGLDDNLRRVEPTQLILPDYDEVDKVYLGENNTLIIAKSGNVYVFGDNRYGQLGLDIADDYINTPVLVSPSRYGNVAAKSAAVNGGVIAIINSNDQLYVAGRNDQGQLGLGDNNNRSTLTLLPATNYDGATINSIHLGSDHSAIVDNNGNVYMFGANDQGQLGLGHTNNRNVPTLLSLPSSQDVEHITLGNKRTLIVTTDGKLYAMGTNANGEFGDGTTIGSNVPKLIPASSYGNKPIIKVATGNTHTGILTNDNMLYLTGLNTYGQLGTSDNVSIKTPNNIKKVVQVYYAKADETLSEGLYYSFDMSLSEFLYRRGYTYQIYTNYDEVTNTYSNLISDTDLVGDIERSIHINYTVNEADQFSKMVSYNVLDNPALNTTGLVTGYLFENVLIPNPNIKGYMIDPEGMTIVTMNKEETEVIIVNMVVNPEDWTQVTFDVPAGSATLNGGTESVVVDVIKDVPLIEQGVIPPTHAFVGYHEQGEGALWPTFDANVAVNGPTTYTLNAVPMPLLTQVFNMPINVYGELNNPVHRN
ncbi:MAG: RCC1 domain-containing protein [Acholeplasmataceae bacterium]